MEKKSIIIFVFCLAAIFLWLLFIGQATGQSAFFGDVNLIDEGQFAAWVSHMLAGKVIYKDVSIQYGPLMIFPTYLLSKMFGLSFFIVRLTQGTIPVFLGIIVAVMVMRWLKVNSFLTVITTILLVLIPGIHMRQFFGVLCILITLLAFKKNSIKLAFLTGILISMAILESIDIGIFTILTILVYLFFRLISSKRTFEDIKIILAIVFASTLAIVLFGLWALQNGWLTDYIKSASQIMFSVSGINLPNGQGLPNVFEGTFSKNPFLHVLAFLFSKSMLFYWSLLFLLISLSIQTIKSLTSRIGEKDVFILLFTIFALVIYISIIGRSGHYFVIVPYVLICFSYFLSICFQQKKSLNYYPKILYIFFISIFLFYALRHLSIFRYNIFANLSLNSTISGISPTRISKSQAKEIVLLRNFFNKHSKKSDKIYVLNNEPGLYFLLNRENSTTYDLPLLEGSLENRLDTISQLIKNPPEYVIEDRKAWAVDGVTDVQRQPEVFYYVKTNYIAYKKVKSFEIYIRKM